MARSSSTLIEWGGIIIVVFFFVPRILAALSTSNLRTATQFSPSAALQAQGARAVNTAGLIGNTALADLLSRLLGRQSSGGGKASPSAGGGGAGLAPRQSVAGAEGGASPFVRTPDFTDFLAGTGPYAGSVNPADLAPPNINFGTPTFDWSSLSFGTPDLPVGPSPDLTGVDFGGDLSGLFSVEGADAASLAAPDLSNVDSFIDPNAFVDFGSVGPDFSSLDSGGGGDYTSFDFGGGDYTYFDTVALADDGSV